MTCVRIITHFICSAGVIVCLFFRGVVLTCEYLVKNVDDFVCPFFRGVVYNLCSCEYLVQSVGGFV